MAGEPWFLDMETRLIVHNSIAHLRDAWFVYCAKLLKHFFMCEH